MSPHTSFVRFIPKGSLIADLWTSRKTKRGLGPFFFRGARTIRSSGPKALSKISASPSGPTGRSLNFSNATPLPKFAFAPLLRIEPGSLLMTPQSRRLRRARPHPRCPSTPEPRERQPSAQSSRGTSQSPRNPNSDRPTQQARSTVAHTPPRHLPPSVNNISTRLESRRDT